MCGKLRRPDFDGETEFLKALEEAVGESERDFLNQLPTSFVLSAEAVDRLRAAAARLILESPDFRQVLKDTGAHIVGPPPSGAQPTN